MSTRTRYLPRRLHRGGDRGDGGTGSGAPAGPLASQGRAKFGDRDAGDSCAVVVPVDLLLDVRKAKFRVLAADFYQEFLDPVVVPLKRRAGTPGLANLSKKVVHHVAHILIIGDPRSRHQVMRGPMLTRPDKDRDYLA